MPEPPDTPGGRMRHRDMWVVGVGLVAACSSGTESNNGSGPTLKVLPPDTTIAVFGTVPYQLVATDENGDTIAPPAVVWTARDSGIAGIAQDGTATGRAAGSTTIVARTAGGDSATARLTVASGAAPCYGIAAARTFTGSVQWGFKAVDQLGESGFRLTADDNGNVNAEMPITASGPSVYQWAGPLGGTSSASVFQRRTDQGNVVATYTSTTGIILPQPPLGLPTLSLTVNLQSCTWRVVTAASVATLLTENGNQTSAVDLVAEIQFAGAVPSDWRTSGIHRANGVMMANTLVYMATHQNQDVLAPLGYAPDLFGPNPAAVESSGGFSISFIE